MPAPEDAPGEYLLSEPFNMTFDRAYVYLNAGLYYSCLGAPNRSREAAHEIKKTIASREYDAERSKHVEETAKQR